MSIVESSATAIASHASSPSSSSSSSDAASLSSDLALFRSLIVAHADFPSPGITFQDIFPLFQSHDAVRRLQSRLAASLLPILSTSSSSPSSSVDVIVGLDSRMAPATGPPSATTDPLTTGPSAAATTDPPPSTGPPATAATGPRQATGPSADPSSSIVIVGLDARGFLFGPGLASSFGCAFAPIRKSGKLPGRCVSDAYTTEYSSANNEISRDAIKAGQRVVIVDDLLATGGTLLSAIRLVRELGGIVVACILVMEIEICEGRKLIIKDANIDDAQIISLIKY